MKNNKTTYKQVKIVWWLILIFVGIYVLIIFSYIYQWGTKPVSKSSLIYLSVIFIVALLYAGWWRVKIDNNYIAFCIPNFWIKKIPIANIKNVSVKPIGLLKISGKFIDSYRIDFVKQNLCIQMKNRKIYQFAVKDAEKIKKEIEKRMITINND
jgi:hypothetical protein